jgi:hypothetical protein
MTSTDKLTVLRHPIAEFKVSPLDQFFARLFDSGKAFCVGWTGRMSCVLITASDDPGDTTRNDDLESKTNQPKGRCAEN